MSQATIGALRVILGLDSAQFTDGLNKAQRHLKSVGDRMQRVGAQMATIGAGLTAAVTAPLIAAGFAASKAATEAAAAMGQVEAALASMGDASGRTKEQLADLAEGLMRNSLYDDDDILRQVTANLLTFGNVAGEQFDRAQQAAVDLSARLGQDLQSSALMVGKALNDPVRGLAALRRVGIQFTAQQEAQIKAMQKAGNTAGAQAVMLGELERQFGGAAAAAQATDPYNKLSDALNSLSESAGAIINRFLVPLVEKLASLADRFNGLSPRMQEFIVIGAGIAAALGPVLVALGAVVSAVGAITAAFATGGPLAFLIPLIPVIAAVAAGVAVAVGAFLLFRKDVEPVLKRLWSQLTATLGPALGDLFETVKGLVLGMASAWKKFFDSEAGQALAKFGAILVEVMGTVLIRTLTAAVRLIDGALKIIGNLFSILGDLLTGDFSGAWNGIRALIGNVIQTVLRVIEAFVPGAIDAMRRLVDGVKMWLAQKLVEVFRGVVDKINVVKNAFFNLYDAVVGHSYIPDMVEGIAEWMAKLDAGMIQPARNATDKTREAFENLRDDVAAIFDRLLTDSERATRQLAQDMAVLDRALASGQITRRQYEQAVGGVAAENLERPERVEPLGPMADGRDIARLIKESTNEAKLQLQAIQDKLNASAVEFGQRFADAMGAALDGDLKGVFYAFFGDVFRNALQNIGQSLFQAFQGGNKGGGSIWSSIGNAVASAFGGGKVPAFANGGSFRVGGTGGIDSQLRLIRATPNEKVTVTKPGQFPEGGMQLFVTPSPYFDTRVERVASPLAARAGVQSAGFSRQAVPADQARRQRFQLARP